MFLGKPVNITLDGIPWIVFWELLAESKKREYPELPAAEPEATVLWEILLGVDRVC